MDEIRIKIEELVNRYIEDIIYQNHDTWNNRLDLMKNNLEIITDINDKTDVNNKDKILVKNITEELIKLGKNPQEVNIKSYLRMRVYEVSKQLKEELSKLSYVENIESIETFDDWIKSLKIYKLNGNYLSLNYYDKSYDLYTDMRKIVLKRNSTVHQKIYAVRVCDKLLEEKNQETLPNKMSLKQGDYELSEIIRLISNSPQYHYELTRHVLYTQIKSNFDTKEHANKLYSLIK